MFLLSPLSSPLLLTLFLDAQPSRRAVKPLELRPGNACFTSPSDLSLVSWLLMQLAF